MVAVKDLAETSGMVMASFVLLHLLSFLALRISGVAPFVPCSPADKILAFSYLCAYILNIGVGRGGLRGASPPPP